MTDPYRSAKEAALIAINDSTYYAAVRRWFKMGSGYNQFPTRIEASLEASRKIRKLSVLPRDFRFFVLEQYQEEYINGMSNDAMLEYKADRLKYLLVVEEQPQQTQEKKIMSDNKLSKYTTQAYAKVELIHGRPIEDWDEKGLMGCIRAARKDQEAVADLVKYSKRMAAKHKQLEDDIAVYTKALDALPE